MSKQLTEGSTMRKLSEKERLEFAAEMEAALQKDTALLLSDSPELATVQAQIALLKNFSVPMFTPSGEQETAQTAGQQGDAIATAGPNRHSKAASLLDFLQETTAWRLNVAQRDAALAIADSLEANPQTRNFAALLSAWKECPALYEFVNSVAGAFINEDMRQASPPSGPRPRLH
jgi:NADH dehydrogenase/NADH:ubiquinone oxidoreductase subunit G